MRASRCDRGRDSRRWIPWTALLLLVVGGGCATTSAPSGWLPSGIEAQREGFGGWIELEYVRQDGRGGTLRGELLAVEADAIYVLQGDSVQAVDRTATHAARLASYDAEWTYLGLWTAIGTLSTLSHGFVLILSAPAWLLAGTVATSTQSRYPILDHPQRPWSAFRPYARFPQGLPARFRP